MQTKWALRYDVNTRCLENQFPLSTFKWSIIFVSCSQLHLGPFNSMGQLEIPSCLILTAGMLVGVVTSSAERPERGRVRKWTLSSLTPAPRPHLYFFFTPPFSLSILPRVKDESNWCKTFKNEFGHMCHLREGEEAVVGARPPALHWDHLLLSPDWPWQNNTLKTHQSKLWSR